MKWAPKLLNNPKNSFNMVYCHVSVFLTKYPHPLCFFSSHQPHKSNKDLTQLFIIPSKAPPENPSCTLTHHQKSMPTIRTHTCHASRLRPTYHIYNALASYFTMCYNHTQEYYPCKFHQRLLTHASLRPKG